MGQTIAAAKSFSDTATEWARDVVEGREAACRWVWLAAQRHLHDLERIGTNGFPYAWNPELPDHRARRLGKATGRDQEKTYRPAERICLFAELMPHIKGDWAQRGERVKLGRWQVFVLASAFGWIHADTGRRRFRDVDVIVPRKNGKSILGAIIGDYMLAVDDEFGAEVYSGATSEYQALEVFKPARLMANASPEFLARYGITVNVSNLSIAANNSKFEPVIGKPGDGASPSCTVVDEYHEHKTSQLYDAMKTGMLARSQALMLVITTAGTDVSSPCYQHQVELQKILEGVVENERRFGIIFTVDEKDDWTSEDALRKANPNFGVSIDAETLLADQREAVLNPRKQSIFKTKHLNIWVHAASPWLNLHNLQRCGDPALTPEEFRGEECTDGLDLASKQDIASYIKLFEREIGGETHYFAFSRNYVPQAAVDKDENAHYQGWVHQGHLIATPGNMIALRQIEEDVVADAEVHVVKEVAMDAWGAREMAPSLQEQGFTVVDIPMQVKYLSEPMKTIAALIDAGRFHHDGNPAFVWMLSNVEVYEDRNGNIFPRKQRPENKIDAAVALIVAMARGMVNVPAGSVYDSRGVYAA